MHTHCQNSCNIRSIWTVIPNMTQKTKNLSIWIYVWSITTIWIYLLRLTYNHVIVVVMEYLSKACRLKDSHNHKRGIYSLHGSLIGSR